MHFLVPELECRRRISNQIICVVFCRLVWVAQMNWDGVRHRWWLKRAKRTVVRWGHGLRVRSIASIGDVGARGVLSFWTRNELNRLTRGSTKTFPPSGKIKKAYRNIDLCELHYNGVLKRACISTGLYTVDFNAVLMLFVFWKVENLKVEAKAHRNRSKRSIALNCSCVEALALRNLES